MKRSICGILLLAITSQAYSLELEEPTINELNRQLENPLSRFWSLIFQENMYFNTGEYIDGTLLVVTLTSRKQVSWISSISSGSRSRRKVCPLVCDRILGSNLLK